MNKETEQKHNYLKLSAHLMSHGFDPLSTNYQEKPFHDFNQNYYTVADRLAMAAPINKVIDDRAPRLSDGRRLVAHGRCFPDAPGVRSVHQAFRRSWICLQELQSA